MMQIAERRRRAVSLRRLSLFVSVMVLSLCRRCSGGDRGVRDLLGAVPRSASNDGLHRRRPMDATTPLHRESAVLHLRSAIISIRSYDGLFGGLALHFLFGRFLLWPSISISFWGSYATKWAHQSSPKISNTYCNLCDFLMNRTMSLHHHHHHHHHLEHFYYKLDIGALHSHHHDIKAI